MPIPDIASPTIPIVAWEDPVIDSLGFDPRSPYVENFWLGILGPSTTLLLRRIAAGLERHPEGFDLSLTETAAALGLGGRGGRNAPVMRSLARCCQFGAAVFYGNDRLAVRRRLPPLTQAQVGRLSPELRDAHRDWVEFDLSSSTAEQQRQRSRRLALSLAELGEDVSTIEHQLHRWRFHPALARDAAIWARDRYREAEAARHEEQGDDVA